MIINKENVEDLIASSSITKPERDELFKAVNELEEVKELLDQMESDTIDYTFEEYVETQEAHDERICRIAKLAKGIRI